MARGWQLKLIRPVESVEITVRKGWSRALSNLNEWMRTILVNALVFGGMGIQGISQTEFYKFISSDEGSSQLGITKADPPMLLRAYEKSFKVSKNSNTMIFRFGDIAELKMGTPHPFATQGLGVTSWLEWIVDDIKVTDAGFVSRSRLPDSLKSLSRLSAPLGGLMLPAGEFGSTGSWQFPQSLVNYDIKWLKDNIKIIEKSITNKLITLLSAELK